MSQTPFLVVQNSTTTTTQGKSQSGAQPGTNQYSQPVNPLPNQTNTYDSTWIIAGIIALIVIAIIIAIAASGSSRDTTVVTR